MLTLTHRRFALPGFATQQGISLRSSVSINSDFYRVLDQAEIGRHYDWQDWAVRAGLGRFPHDAGIIARCLIVALDRNTVPLVRSLRVILLSLPVQHLEDPLVYDALARADFTLGDLDRGAGFIAQLAQKFPKYDLAIARTVQLGAMADPALSGAALDLARNMVAHPKTHAARIETFLRHNAYLDIIAVIDQAGGADRIDDPDLAAVYITALEAVGRLEQAMEFALSFLHRVPQSPRVAQGLRGLAIRLDRLHEARPALERAAFSLSGRPDGYDLLALLAMDTDDYARARRILALSDGPPNREMILSLALTDPATPRHIARRAYHAARKKGPQHAGPEMQYASFLMNEARRPADLREALQVTQAGLQYSLGNPYFHRLHLTVLIANNQLDQAKAYFASLPKDLQQTQRLQEVAIYFDHISGAVHDAKHAWQDYAKIAGYRVYGAKTTRARRIKETPIAGKVIAFSVVYNGMDYLPAYFDHYRALGVKSFVFVDNNSSDGTRDYLAQQSDVTFYAHKGSFRAAAHGVAWINPLIQRYARGKWALFVDVDEHLVFPLLDQGRSIEDLVDYAEKAGAGSFPSFMLDMFATPRSFAEGFAGHRYFDPQYLRYPSVSPPFITVQGGVRGRMTGRHFLITKSPLVRVDRDVHFTENNHHHSYLPTCDVTTALLHYKFVGDTKHKFTEAVTRGEHFLGGRFYRDMLTRMRGQGIRAGLWARQYRGVGQLLRLGLIQGTIAWQDWGKHDR